MMLGEALLNALDGTTLKKYYLEALEKAKTDTRSEAQIRADKLNEEHDWLDSNEYDCSECMNRGWTAKVVHRGDREHVIMPECKCMKIRRAIRRMRKSGIEQFVKESTFDKFEANEEWQIELKSAAVYYVTEKEYKRHWFFIGGQSGSGKTHICTAIIRKLLYIVPVIYMAWESDSKELKALVMDADEYSRQIEIFKNAPILYIDDLFKPIKDKYGKMEKPTTADVRLAFEIINYRYINNLCTILSSERYLTDIVEIDEALGTRIAEKCGDFRLSVKRDKSKNHRISHI